jgi:hypothetical protein
MNSEEREDWRPEINVDRGPVVWPSELALYRCLLANVAGGSAALASLASKHQLYMLRGTPHRASDSSITPSYN